MGNLQQAQLVVDLAKDTIRYLSHLNNTTNFYRKLQVFYHQFLSSAIAVLFLASVHAPVEFSAICRKEFYMGLELVKDLSAKSWVSQRLWRTVGALKEVAPRIGLRQQDDDDAHSTAAFTMAGLAAGQPTSHNSPAPISPFGRGSVASTPGAAGPPPQTATGPQSPDNGVRLQSEMSRIYEGYVGFKSLASSDPGGASMANGGVSTPSSAGGPGNRFPSADATVFQHFKEMF